ncbi:MAG: hypothetical protein KAT04_15465 [Methylococcales bacterium]|nr:hypothetical protein [Methylococcales bacterium]
MKIFSACLLTGLVILYFIDSALSIENLNMEMFTHNLVRFFAGFVFLGIGGWYKHKLKFKISLYLIVIFLVSDDIFDYIRNIDNLSFDMLLHDLFIVIWGALSGFFFLKSIFKSNG